MKKSVFALLAGMAALSMCGIAHADVIYDSIPSTLPTNMSSLGYQATQTSEFGDEIQFVGNARNLTQVDIALSDWALYSTYSSDARYSTDSSHWALPLTLTLYNVGTGNSIGSAIASETISASIAWRPEAEAGCGSGFHGADGQCYNGLAQTVTFDFTGTVVPDEVIYGLSFNTQSYGSPPIGVDGPYNSLNFALNDVSGPSVGTDMNPDGVFWDTSNGAWLANSSNAGQFAEDTNWSPYVPAARFTAVPEPSTVALFGAGLLGLGFWELCKRRENRA